VSDPVAGGIEVAAESGRGWDCWFFRIERCEWKLISELRMFFQIIDMILFKLPKALFSQGRLAR